MCVSNVKKTAAESQAFVSLLMVYIRCMIYDKLPVVFLSTLAAEKKDSTNKIIAEYILAHQDEIRNISIKELAAACHVGTGSLSRFVRDIGLNDFAELKLLLTNASYRFEKADLSGYASMAEAQNAHIAEAVEQALLSLDGKQIEKLCRDIHDHEKVYACGMLKAQNAAVDLQVDLRMLGKHVETNIAYADQMEHVLHAGRDELIIVFSYTGAFFAYTNLRNKEKNLRLPRIWMICGSEAKLPDYIDEVVRFKSDNSQRSHPFQLEAVESLIVQEYARLF